jgi:hypothetical protein
LKVIELLLTNWKFFTGADPGFQVRGGAVKKIAPSGGRRENFWGISCEKSRFYAKKSYFSNFRGGTRNFWGISCEKSRFYAKKNHIFSNFRGGARRVRPPLSMVFNARGVSTDNSAYGKHQNCVLHLLFINNLN